MQAAGWTAEGDEVTSVFACVPAKVLSLVVVPLLYQSPPSTSADAIKTYNDTLPYVTQANQQALFADIAAWWSKETYGRNRLDVTVLPAITVAGNPACDTLRPQSGKGGGECGGADLQRAGGDSAVCLLEVLRRDNG